MKHKAKLTISRQSYGDGSRKISIQVRDVDARIKFIEIEIDYSNFAECLTGLSDVDCDMELNGLKNVGKVKETKQIEFKIGDVGYDKQKEVATKIAHKLCPKGWYPYCYFGSQSSFFRKDGEQWARTTISRWVEK